MEYGNLIVTLLFASISVSLSAVSVAIVVLILLNKGSLLKGVGYLTGWVAGLLLLTGISYYFLDSILQLYESPFEKPEFGGIKFLVGLMFIFLSRKIWHSRPKAGDEIPHSRLFDQIDKLNFMKASILAFILQITNIKNITLVFIATYILVKMEYSLSIELVLLILFIFISSLTLLLPLLFIVFMGDQVRPTLENIKNWLLFNNKAILAVMLFATGVFVVVENLVKVI